MSLKKKQLELSYKYPPDFDSNLCLYAGAYKHRLAMRIFKGIHKDQTMEEC